MVFGVAFQARKLTGTFKERVPGGMYTKHEPLVHGPLTPVQVHDVLGATQLEPYICHKKEILFYHKIGTKSKFGCLRCPIPHFNEIQLKIQESSLVCVY